MPARRALPNDDHVMRFVPRSKQHRDADTDQFLGVTFAAFRLREEDKGGLSVTWIEHFGQYGPASKQAAAIAYRQSLPSGKLGPQGAFASAQNSKILEAGSKYKKRLRVVHDPVTGNSGHAEIRHFTDEDLELLDYLVTDVFLDIDLVASLNLP